MVANLRYQRCRRLHMLGNGQFDLLQFLAENGMQIAKRIIRAAAALAKIDDFCHIDGDYLP